MRADQRLGILQCLPYPLTSQSLSTIYKAQIKLEYSACPLQLQQQM